MHEAIVLLAEMRAPVIASLHGAVAGAGSAGAGLRLRARREEPARAGVREHRHQLDLSGSWC